MSHRKQRNEQHWIVWPILPIFYFLCNILSSSFIVGKVTKGHKLGHASGSDILIWYQQDVNVSRSSIAKFIFKFVSHHHGKVGSVSFTRAFALFYKCRDDPAVVTRLTKRLMFLNRTSSSVVGRAGRVAGRQHSNN